MYIMCRTFEQFNDTLELALCREVVGVSNALKMWGKDIKVSPL